MSEPSKGAPTDPESVARVQQEQLVAVRSNTPTMMLANVCNALILVIGFWESPDTVAIVLWFIALSIVSGYVYLRHYKATAKQKQQGDSAKSVERAVHNGLALGLLWAALPLFFLADAGGGGRLLICVVMAGILCGAAFALASIPRAAFCFIGPVAIGTMIALARCGGKANILVAFLLCVYTLVLLKAVLSYAGLLKARVLTEIVRTKELTEASEAKSIFMANMSHEIRTPLNGVLGLAQLLERETLSPKQIEMVRRLREAGATLLSIVNDILDFSKLEAGEFRLDRRPFELGSILGHIGSLFGGSARAKGLKLVVEVAPQLNGVPIGDALRIEQVLMNLVGNAIKFTERGEVRLSVRATALEASRARLQFEVKDTGIGIALEHMSGLFKPFTQADAAITRRFGGTGLGLSISKSLVELMDGEIGASSVLGKGSTFWFEAVFDLSPVKAQARRTFLPSGTSASARLSGMRFLVADDSAMNREVVERLLTLEGARIVLAENGQEALDFLRSGREPVDAVLMDVQMPVMDGLTAIRAIRGALGLTGLPIIALTAGVLDEERHQVLDAGADDFVSKPIELEGLVDILLLRAKRAPVSEPAMISNCPDAFPVVAGLNTAWVEKTLGGDRDLFVSLLASFSEEFREAAPQVEECLARNDPEEAARRLHALRGGASYIGAEDLVAAAKALESAVLDRRSELEPLTAAFTKNHRLVINAIKSALAEIEPLGAVAGTAGGGSG
ncbi:two-component system, NarL family, sensor histidine kinase BarA [Methylocystis bryophila]